jgi:multidrug efflux system membrane fusion protein
MEQHPEGGAEGPRKGRRGCCVVVAVVAALVVIGGGIWLYFWLTAAPKAKPKKPVVPVVAMTSRIGDLPMYLTGLGNVTPLNTVTVHTRVDGEIQKVGYVEGQEVREGDLLVELDPRPFQVQLTQAQGQFQRDQASLKDARLDLARYEKAGAAASQQQRDTAAATVGQLEGAVVTDQGNIDSAKLNLVYCHITSPLAGRVGLRLVDPGNIVHQTDAGGVVVITQIEPMTVIFTLAEDDLPKVLKAEHGGIGLAVQAWNRDLTTYLATGSLTAIDNQINVTTGTVQMRAQFENKDHALPEANQFVNVKLLVATRRGAVLIPAAAVQQNPQGAAFVYVVNTVQSSDRPAEQKPDQKPVQTVEARPIKVGPTEADTTVVESGLAAGETVVTDGVDKLQPGTKVDVRLPGAASSANSAMSATSAWPATSGVEARSAAAPAHRK